MDIGSAVGREAGVTEQQICELPRYASSDAFSDLEKRVIDYAVEMTKTPVDVPEELFHALRVSLDSSQLVEITAAIAWENYRARFNHALGIEAQGFSGGAVCVIPERPLSSLPSS
jgi:alkylhydroperoxidase family enzyme